MQQFNIVAKAFGLQGSLLLGVLVFLSQLLVLLFQILDAGFVHFLSRSVLFLSQQHSLVTEIGTVSSNSSTLTHTHHMPQFHHFMIDIHSTPVMRVVPE
jgi:hypothetical protein